MMDIPDFFNFAPGAVKMDPNNYGYYSVMQGFPAAAATIPQKPFDNGYPMIINKSMVMKQDPFLSSPPPPQPSSSSSSSSVASTSHHHHHHHHHSPAGGGGANGGFSGGGGVAPGERDRLHVNGQAALLKLKRVDNNGSDKPLDSMTPPPLPLPLVSNYSQQHVKIKSSTSAGGISMTDGEMDCKSCSSSDTDEDLEVAPKKSKKSSKNSSNSTSSTSQFQFPDKLQVFPGRFPCNFCPIVWSYAPELALHETMEHSKPTQVVVASSNTSTASSSSNNNNQGSGVKRRYFCPRCNFNVLGRQRYINHHLKEHLGLEVPPKVKKPKPDRSAATDIFDSFPCDICLAPLSKSNSYSKRDHFRVYHNTKGVDPATVEHCDQCPAYFLRGIQLLRHKQQFHGTLIMNENPNTKRHPCQSCHKRFYYLPQLWAHRRDSCELRHTFTWVATCTVDGCGLKFESTADLDYHITNTHSNDKYKGALVQCPLCERKCVGQFGLITHMASHDDGADGQLECQLCGEKLKSRLYFNRHMKRHLNEEEGFEDFDGESPSPYVCDQCGKSFTTQSLLELHYEFHKDPTNWRFQCEICSKKCSTKQSLQVHTRTHTGERPFICQVCGESFAYRHFLRWHVNQKHQQEGIEDMPRTYNKNSLADGGSHQGRRKDPKNSEFVCEQCNKHFSTKQALQVHGRLHTGEKPFECQVCGEKFRYRHFLRSHVNQKHQQEGFKDVPRPYRKNSDAGGGGGGGIDGIRGGGGGGASSSCSSSSISVGDLIDIKPTQLLSSGSSSSKSQGFECSVCSKSFSTKQSMQVHFRTHTGEKPFECQVCGERFRYRHVLRTHVNTRHEKEGIKDVPRPYNKRGGELSKN